MVGSLSKSCGWVWEEVISSKERKEAAVFRTKYAERKKWRMSSMKIYACLCGRINVTWSV